VAGAGAFPAPALRRAGRRRRPRQATNPAPRVAGAWATVVDDLVLAGVPHLSDRTAGTVVIRASRRVPTAVEELLELSFLANRSAFSGHDPQDGDEDRAWTLARSIVGTRRQSRSPAQKFREYFRW
jgi:hypothetical protein